MSFVSITSRNLLLSIPQWKAKYFETSSIFVKPANRGSRNLKVDTILPARTVAVQIRRTIQVRIYFVGRVKISPHYLTTARDR
jgi:hypothetical protein